MKTLLIVSFLFHIYGFDKWIYVPRAAQHVLSKAHRKQTNQKYTVNVWGNNLS